MVLSEVERDIIKTVVQRFVNLNESSPRSLLARRHRSSQAFCRLRDSGILRNTSENAPTDDEVYLPRALAFYYCGDPEALSLARKSVTIVIRALQNLFDVELDKKQFSPSDLQAQANKIFKPPPQPELLRLGLYLARDIGVLTIWSPANASIEPTIFQIAEHIVEIRNFDKVWDDFIVRSTATFEGSPPRAVPTLDSLTNDDILSNVGGPHKMARTPGEAVPVPMRTRRSGPAAKEKRWWETRWWGIIILAVVAGLIIWGITRYIDKLPPNTTSIWVIAGVVVDSNTNQSLPRAEITIPGRTEKNTTDDNGNFRIELYRDFPASKTLRVRVTKPGYKTRDETVTVPANDLYVLLEKD